MKQQGHEDAYRIAFESANAELNDISVAFEQLRTRKNQLERLVVVLGAFVDRGDQSPRVEASASENSATPLTQSKTDEASARPLDPFQRRVDHFLGIGSGIRDVRKYTRQF
jgi:hypothetical protein